MDGRRRWLRPRLSPGGFWRKRLLVAWVLIALYTVIPWLTVDGMPMVLLDLVERKFVFFGTVFRPTETLLFGVLFLAVFVAIFLLTAVFGRVWCGWACPQTVYMEFVYRPVERFFLGKAYANPKVSVSPWRRAAMYAVYLVVSAHLANTLLAWFVGADRLTSWIFTSTPATHPVAFAVFAAVTLLMMFDFAFFLFLAAQLLGLLALGDIDIHTYHAEQFSIGGDPGLGIGLQRTIYAMGVEVAAFHRYAGFVRKCF